MFSDNNDCGIEITAPEQCQLNDGVLVRGKFRVQPGDIGIPEQPTLIPKHIAMVVTHYLSYSSCKPFWDVVVFEDDVKDDGTCIMGTFNFNVFDHVPFDQKGEYCILCSIGTHLSDIIKVVVV